MLSSFPFLALFQTKAIRRNDDLHVIISPIYFTIFIAKIKAFFNVFRTFFPNFQFQSQKTAFFALLRRVFTRKKSASALRCGPLLCATRRFFTAFRLYFTFLSAFLIRHRKFRYAPYSQFSITRSRSPKRTRLNRLSPRQEPRSSRQYLRRVPSRTPRKIRLSPH